MTPKKKIVNKVKVIKSRNKLLSLKQNCYLTEAKCEA
jgi:hypothetical protein